MKRKTILKSSTHVLTKQMRAGLAEGALLLFAVASLVGCGENRPQPEVASSHGDSGLFSVPADQLQHLQIVTLKPTSVDRVQSMTGTVAYNAFHTTPVISQVSGPVVELMALPGQQVKRGEPMLYASSPEYSQLRSGYIKARDAYNVAEKNYNRAKDLYDHHAISEKDLLDAESAKNQSYADLQASTQGLEIVGIPKAESVEKNASPKIPVLAPISGEVVERLVSPGQLLQAGSTQCFTISDLSTVWVMVNVYERDLAFIHIGDEVEIKTEAYPTTFHGKISFLGAAVDPTSRTLQARIVTDNPHDLLKKDMYVVATVHAGKAQDVLAVPDTAILRDAENQPYVYVAQGNAQFARRQITIGPSTAGTTQVQSGLKSGDQVVGDGALFLQFANSLQQ
jgi:membrane fusion protein, heavy metal efflux system